MIDTAIEKAARQVAEQSAREQGLPAKITDRATLEKVSAIVKHDEKDQAA